MIFSLYIVVLLLQPNINLHDCVNLPKMAMCIIECACVELLELIFPPTIFSSVFSLVVYCNLQNCTFILLSSSVNSFSACLEQRDIKTIAAVYTIPP